MTDAYLGEIRVFAGNYAPEGWSMCDGSSLSVQQYPALFSLIGNAYGGDAVTTFALPDLRGRLAVGMGQGPGLTNRVISTIGGTEQVQLTMAQMPAHTHTMKVSTDSQTPSVNAPSIVTYIGPVSTSAATAVGYLPGGTAGITVKPMDPSTISTTGGSGAHNNLMPYAVVSYIICLNGFYPTPA